VLSKQGQRLVRQDRYLPLPASTAARQMQKLD